MRRWNGWGDDTVNMAPPPEAGALLKELVGEAAPKDDYPLDNLIQKVPDSRMPEHDLISRDPATRIHHAHGQSLPDWVDMRMGTLDHFPDGVAFPAADEELREVLRFAQKNNVIVIPYGGGTSVVGHLTVPESDRPVLTLSMQRMGRMLELDETSRLATFEAGVLGPDVEAQLRAKGFTLGHYPQSFEYASLGGWVVTRSSGQQSSHFGRIEQLFAGGQIITPQGVMDFPPHPASAAGPDLKHLVLGSEGRLGILSKATVRISSLPARDTVYGVFFPAWENAVEAVRLMADFRVPYSMVRLSNATETMTNLALAGHEKQIDMLKRYLRLRNVQDVNACMCLIGFTGSQRITRAARRKAFSVFKKYDGVVVGKAMGDAWKKNRFRAPYLRNTLWEMGYAVDTLETAVTWDRVSDTIQKIETVIANSLEDMNEKVHVFTHLSHIYSTGSSIYTSYVFRIADTPEETLQRWRRLKQAASQVIVEQGGTISHQHGVGADHAMYLRAEKGDLGIKTLNHLFSFFDPDGRMNPGKLVKES